jgi:hypothetical protein
MLPTRHEQAIMGDLPEPEMKGKCWALKIRVDAANRLELRFLHHIGSIDAGSQTGIEPQADDVAQIGAVALQEAIERTSVAAVDGIEEATGFFGIRRGLGHGNGQWSAGLPLSERAASASIPARPGDRQEINASELVAEVAGLG